VNGKQVVTPVQNEIWVKEHDGQWRLLKLGVRDAANLVKARKERQLAEERKLEAQAQEGMSAEDVEKIKFYSSEGKRDPFESLIVAVATEGAAVSQVGQMCDPKRRREYLESFDLFSLKLVGVIKGDGYFALIETPNGNGYTVKPGMYMGKHCGRISRITDRKVIVAEKYFSPRFGFKIKKMELKLKREEG